MNEGQVQLPNVRTKGLLPARKHRSVLNGKDENKDCYSSHIYSGVICN